MVDLARFSATAGHVGWGRRSGPALHESECLLGKTTIVFTAWLSSNKILVIGVSVPQVGRVPASITGRSSAWGRIRPSCSRNLGFEPTGDADGAADELASGVPRIDEFALNCLGLEFGGNAKCASGEAVT